MSEHDSSMDPTPHHESPVTDSHHHGVTDDAATAAATMYSQAQAQDLANYQAAQHQAHQNAQAQDRQTQYANLPLPGPQYQIVAPTPTRKAVYVRNTRPQPLVLAYDESGQRAVVWQGAGSPNGEDVQLVQPFMQDLSTYERLIRLGLIVEVEDPLIAQQHEEEMRRKFEAAELARATADPSVLQRSEHKSFSMVQCIAPTGMANQTCNQGVAIKTNEQHETPPLCDRHRHLQGQYLQEATGNMMADGRTPEMKWTRVSIPSSFRRDS